MQAELRPRGGFEDLFEGAESARQANKAVAEFIHASFALVHVGNNLERGYFVFGNPICEQPARDYPDDFTASFHGCLGHRSHEPAVPAAVDQCQALMRESLPDSLS